MGYKEDVAGFLKGNKEVWEKSLAKAKPDAKKTVQKFIDELQKYSDGIAPGTVKLLPKENAKKAIKDFAEKLSKNWKGGKPDVSMTFGLIKTLLAFPPILPLCAHMVTNAELMVTHTDASNEAYAKVINDWLFAKNPF
jgi:hypothetical protein